VIAFFCINSKREGHVAQNIGCTSLLKPVLGQFCECFTLCEAKSTLSTQCKSGLRKSANSDYCICLFLQVEVYSLHGTAHRSDPDTDRRRRGYPSDKCDYFRSRRPDPGPAGNPPQGPVHQCHFPGSGREYRPDGIAQWPVGSCARGQSQIGAGRLIQRVQNVKKHLFFVKSRSLKNKSGFYWL